MRRRGHYTREIDAYLAQYPRSLIFCATDAEAALEAHLGLNKLIEWRDVARLICGDRFP
jgi:hypothetical protein